MLKKCMWVILGLTSATVNIALADTQMQPPSGMPQSAHHLDVTQLFAQLDKNGDGEISKSELTDAGVSQHLMMADSNHDGMISEKELENMPFPPPADANHDGILTLTELLNFEAHMSSDRPSRPEMSGHQQSSDDSNDQQDD
ncbi:MAG: hypothetical protein CENE_03459 [Candidatus Celerinatantimonas neptuna]|nr:MAG: hypothetical protein CENE_03459 [Candidatus Celerinatantimonas neptuna]